MRARIVLPLFVLAVLPFTGCDTTPQGTKDERNKKYTRDEFQNLVMGKTENEVRNSLGRPTKIKGDDKQPSVVIWVYGHVTTYDPATQREDGGVEVSFAPEGAGIAKGKEPPKVRHVNFLPAQ
jgi:hypothetical protein